MKYNCKCKIEESYLESLLRLRGISNISELLITLDKEDNNILFIIDCDQDGFTSSAMLWKYIKKIYPNSNLSYKIHSGKQHGLEDMIDEIEANDKKFDLIIIPDAGSNDYDYHKRLVDLGSKVIVLDHHEAEKYSEYAIVVNNQLSKEYPNKGLSGAGVVYKFLEVLDRKLSIKEADNYIDLAAVGIIGDMMSTIPTENRYIISEGLKNIKNPCIEEIINKQSFSIKDRFNITPTDVSFYITPLINALIRVGKASEKEILFQAFIDGKKMVPKLSRGKVVEGQFESIGEQNARNCVNARSRQNRAKEKAMEQLEMKIIKNSLDENKIIFVQIDDEVIDTTLTGLIAMQLMAKYKKPVIVARENDEGFWKGSARGDSKSELKDLRQFFLDSGYFEFAEGHAAAHGISIHNDKINGFIDYANTALSSVDFNEGVYEADFILNAEDSGRIAEIILSLGQYPEVWGKDNEEPIIVVENINLKDSDISIIGSNKDTIKFCIDGVTYIQFKAKQLIEDIQDKKVFSMAVLGTPNINEWGGQNTPQLMIKDYNFKNTLFDF